MIQFDASVSHPLFIVTSPPYSLPLPSFLHYFMHSIFVSRILATSTVPFFRSPYIFSSIWHPFLAFIFGVRIFIPLLPNSEIGRGLTMLSGFCRTIYFDFCQYFWSRFCRAFVPPQGYARVEDLYQKNCHAVDALKEVAKVGGFSRHNITHHC